MSRQLIIINAQSARIKLKALIDAAPWNTRVTIQEPKRSLPQNAKLWAALSDVAEQVTYHGLKLAPDDYKLLFLDALKREVRMVPNLDGNGFVSLGRSSSDLSKSEMADLLTIIEAWGAQNGVVFQDQREAVAA
jgi:hypothetical protein